MTGKAPRAPIADAMAAYAADGAIAFHTPGHKQGKGAHEKLRALVTEEGLREEVSLMEELDDLHDPHGVIREAQQMAAHLYHADASWFMVNGTTGAIHTMMMSVLQPGDTVLVQRNAHRSVYGALVLSGARPVYLAPEADDRLGILHGVSSETVRQSVAAHPEAKAVVLVNPTYYGVTTELAEIAGILHDAGMMLLVDEAHGPHLAFSDKLPMDAMASGADMAAQSTHKILGAMTQGSLLLAQGSLVDYGRVQEVAGLLQTTSPNQLLLASIDIARLQMEEEGRERLARTVVLAEKTRARIDAIPGLWCFGERDIGGPGARRLDVTKLTVNLGELSLTGPAAEDILRHEYKVQCELSDAANLLFILSYADTEKEADVLAASLRDLAARYRREGGAGKETHTPLPPLTEPVLTPREAFFAMKESVLLEEAVGHSAAEEATCYPPGIPVLVPGERVTKEAVTYIQEMQRLGRRIIGTRDRSMETLLVVRK